MSRDVSQTDPDNPPEVDIDDIEVRGLEELLPAPLMPAYRQLERFNEARDTYGPTITSYLELLLAVVLIGGYVYWLYLFFVAA